MNEKNKSIDNPPRMSHPARMFMGLLYILEGLSVILTLGFLHAGLVLRFAKWDAARRWRKHYMK